MNYNEQYSCAVLDEILLKDVVKDTVVKLLFWKTLGRIQR